MNERSLKRWLSIVDEAAEIGVQQPLFWVEVSRLYSTDLSTFRARQEPWNVWNAKQQRHLINKDKVNTLLRIGWDELPPVR